MPAKVTSKVNLSLESESDDEKDEALTGVLAEYFTVGKQVRDRVRDNKGLQNAVALSQKKDLVDVNSSAPPGAHSLVEEQNRPFVDLLNVDYWFDMNVLDSKISKVRLSTLDFEEGAAIAFSLIRIAKDGKSFILGEIIVQFWLWYNNILVGRGG